MRRNLKTGMFTLMFMVLGGLYTSNAQTACCSTSSTSKKTEACKPSTSGCETKANTNTTTSGCSPSGCRGAKTKFGEAKVISNLRLDLIALKAKMEQSVEPEFSKRSYDIHGIIGETDAESLEIIAREVKLMESEFTTRLNFKPNGFDLPEQKAKQVKWLSARIKSLNKVLE